MLEARGGMPGVTQFTGGGPVNFDYHGTAVAPHSSAIAAATVNSATKTLNVIPPNGISWQCAVNGPSITDGTAQWP